jgi:amino acid adenylation domain-containing protein
MTAHLAWPESTAPASFAQERMWVAEQLDGAPAYNIQLGLRIRGSLDEAALRSAVADMTARHEALRTSFIPHDDGLACAVRPAGPVAIHLMDASDAHDPQAALDSLATAELDTAFDPAEGKTFRVALIRTAADDHVLLITLDHLVCDPWSVQILHNDLTEGYSRCVLGGQAPPAPAYTYRDFAQWQRHWLAGPQCPDQLSYWRDHLPPRPPRLMLPELPGAARTRQMRSYSAALDADLAASSAQVGRRFRASQFMVLFAVYSALLGRYGRHDEVMVGTLCHGRTQPEAEQVVGFFANAVTLRADVSGHPSLAGMLARVREIVLDAFDNADVPFDHVVSAVNPERPAGARPFFDAIFQLADVERPSVQLDGLSLEPLPAVSHVSGADVALTIVREAGGHQCRWDFDGGLLTDATVARMHGHFVTLLAQALADPGRPLDDIDVLGADERTAIEAFNTTAPAAGEWTLPDAFEAQAAARPDHPALSYGTTSVSYAEVNAQANQVASALAELGAGPESVVGLFLDDRADAVVTALSVLKAGAAYLPVDPAYPSDRIGFMLADAAPLCVVTRAHLADRLRGTLPSITLEELQSRPARLPAHNPRRPLSADNLAYVMYTSGSTGRPKGVAVAHRGFATITTEQRRTLGLRSDDRVLQMSSPNFDMSLFEALMAFSAGATLCVAPAEVAVHGDLGEALRSTRVTAAVVTPSMLASLGDDEPAPELRTLAVAGEACPVALASRWSRDRRFFNLYGPTEASIWSTSQPVNEAGSESGTMPIGRPLPGVGVYVVTSGECLAPVGVPGELRISGDVLARGYWGRPGLTAERFTPDTFSGVDGSRVYRTGDLARWREDGVLEFLGRIDHQVKIRGYRIEIGEVENCLATHPAVLDVVVVARDQELHAYVEAHGETGATGLREHCARTLPGYMVPARFLALDRLPRTPNGKIDRGHLPEISNTSAAAAVPPRTEMERTCARIWAAVLGLDEVGILDDFFERGGHSLAATRVISRVRRDVGVRLSVRVLFEHPVLADFAALADRQARGDGAVRSAAIDPAAR